MNVIAKERATVAISILQQQKPSISLGGSKGRGNLLRHWQKSSHNTRYWLWIGFVFSCPNRHYIFI